MQSISGDEGGEAGHYVLWGETAGYLQDGYPNPIERLRKICCCRCRANNPGVGEVVSRGVLQDGYPNTIERLRKICCCRCRAINLGVGEVVRREGSRGAARLRCSLCT